jgi:hypothetical protein
VILAAAAQAAAGIQTPIGLMKYTDIITMLVAVIYSLLCNEARRLHVLPLGILLGFVWIVRGFFPL